MQSNAMAEGSQTIRRVTFAYLFVPSYPDGTNLSTKEGDMIEGSPGVSRRAGLHRNIAEL